MAATQHSKCCVRKDVRVRVPPSAQLIMFKRNKHRKVQIFTWSPELAYAVGLIATDGCLSSNGKMISFTSKDIEQINNFQKALGINITIGYTQNERGVAFRVQICNVQFYDWLVSIGFTPKKSLTIGAIAVPDEYFVDFLRGHLDGDGSITVYTDLYNTKVKAEYVYRRIFVRFISASKEHVDWLQEKIKTLLNVRGARHITKPATKNHNPIHMIKFGKKESLKLLSQLYYSPELPCLSRKKGIYLEFINSI